MDGVLILGPLFGLVSILWWVFYVRWLVGKLNRYADALYKISNMGYDPCDMGVIQCAIIAQDALFGEWEEA
jgi:hypothetical protein